MTRLLLVGLGGFLGAISRYGLTHLVHRLTGLSFPLGTLLVNVLGCFAAGCAMSAVDEHELLSVEARAFLVVGLLGAFTTFSTFGVETVSLLKAGQTGQAALSVAGNLLLGVLAAWAGWRLVRGL